jgi:hypothetical protein
VSLVAIEHIQLPLASIANRLIAYSI